LRAGEQAGGPRQSAGHQQRELWQCQRVQLPAQPEQQRPAGEGRAGIQGAEFAVAQVKGGANLAAEEGDEEGLAEARRPGRQQAERQKPPVRTDESQISHPDRVSA
jgi:hypothetical protein